MMCMHENNHVGTYSFGQLIAVPDSCLATADLASEEMFLLLLPRPDSALINLFVLAFKVLG